MTMQREETIVLGMRRWYRAAAVAVTGLVGPAAGAWAQGGPRALPLAQEVLARFVAAIGGRDAVQRQTSRHYKVHLDIPSQGIQGDIDIYAAQPNRLLVRTEVPGIGMIRQGYDGTVGWLIHPALGAQVVTGLMLNQLRQQAEFYAALHPETLIKSATTVARETFAGHAAYKVEIVTQWDETYHEYFDTESGLLIGVARRTATPSGLIDATTVLSDYRDFQGVKQPMKATQSFMGVDQVLTTTSVEVNPSLAASTFELPKEIQTLVGG